MKKLLFLIYWLCAIDTAYSAMPYFLQTISSFKQQTVTLTPQQTRVTLFFTYFTSYPGSRIKQDFLDMIHHSTMGCPWLMFESIDVISSTITYEGSRAVKNGNITFTILPNTNNEDRLYNFFNYDGRSRVSLKQPKEEVQVFRISGGGKAFPGQKCSIVLSGSERGVIYKVNVNGKVVATANGTGGSFSFSFLYEQPGTYTVSGTKNGKTALMQGQVIFVNYDIYNHVHFLIPLAEIAADGGKIMVDYSLSGGDAEELTSIINNCNKGGYTSWNSAFRLSGSVPGKLEITVGPNTTITDRKVSINLGTSSDNKLVVQQKGNGSILVYDLTLIGDPDKDDVISLCLNGSQYEVIYTLYYQENTASASVKLETKKGNQNSLMFYIPVKSGLYHIKAVYDEKTVAMRNTINVTPLVKTASRHAIRVHTYTGNSDKNIDIIYYDDWGRPIQTNSVGASVSGKDVVVPIKYDRLGRRVKEYLPYVVEGNGEYRIYDVTEQNAFYRRQFGLTEDADAYAYYQNVYELSSLASLLEQSKPGKAFSVGEGHTVKYDYDSNKEQEVKLYRWENKTLTLVGYYPTGSLYRTKVTDADGQEAVFFKDGTNKTIMGKDKSGSTYFVYDSLEHLVLVMPPMCSEVIGQIVPDDKGSYIDPVKAYCYEYKYDIWGNMIAKSLPGQPEENYEYDTNQLLIRKTIGERNFHYEYDCFYRPIAVKFRKGAATEICVVAEYGYDNIKTMVGELPVVPTGNYFGEAVIPVKGLKTYEKIRILEEEDLFSEEGRFIERRFFYDDLGRINLVEEKNGIDGIKVRYSYKYDRQNNITAVCEEHSSLTILRQNRYDSRSRLLEEEIRINGTSCAKVQYSYNELGQMQRILYGNPSYAVNLDYDLQGHLVRKECDKLSMKFRYESPVKAVGRYGGEVTEWEWQYAGQPQELYAFSYDGNGRLKGNRQYENGVLTDRFTENEMTYDREGNIQTLKRTSEGRLTEDLQYIYAGNRLVSLTDRISGGNLPDTINIQYDLYGNMIKDNRESLELSYNFLNLLNQVRKGGVLTANYLYGGDGTKLRVTNASGKGYEYSGSCIYSRNGSSLTLESIGFSQGRIVPGSNGSGYEAVYYVTDDIGSVRIVVDAQGNVKEQNDYYPFGSKHLRSDYPQFALNRYKFSGKEEQTLGITGCLDFGARIYNPRLGRWLGSDYFAESYSNISPYAYCLNNPVSFTDPNGLWVNLSSGYYTDDPKEMNLFWEFVLGNNGKFMISDVEGFISANGGFKESFMEGTYLLSEIKITGQRGNFMLNRDSYERVCKEMWELWYASQLGEGDKKFFSTETIAYQFMWNNSFENGQPVREVSGWLTKQGHVVVLPWDNNTLGESENKTLIHNTKGRFITYGTAQYGVVNQVHTHPIKADRGYSVSTKDKELYDDIRLPIHILYYGKIYVYDGTYNYKTKEETWWNGKRF